MLTPFRLVLWATIVSHQDKRIGIQATCANAVWEGCQGRGAEKKDVKEPEKSPNVQNERNVTHLPSAEPSIRETSDVEGKSGTDDQARRLQHLRHT
jgi:hypothetical protein